VVQNWARPGEMLGNMFTQTSDSAVSLTYSCSLCLLACYCRRTLPETAGLDKVAAALKKYKIHGLLLLGGFEVRKMESLTT
jgi:hypothetical protein